MNMSMWCPKCNKINYNKSKCDFCGHKMEDTSKSYKVPKNKGARIVNMNKAKNSIEINKNIILTIASVIIAISVSYLAYHAATEDSRMLKRWFGSDNPEEIKQNIEKAMKEVDIKLTETMIQSNKKLAEQTTEAIKNIKTPKIDFGKYQREQEQKKIAEERNRQIFVQRKRREAELEKERNKQNLLLQMQN